jgi:hypothetical protein
MTAAPLKANVIEPPPTTDFISTNDAFDAPDVFVDPSYMFDMAICP